MVSPGLAVIGPSLKEPLLVTSRSCLCSVEVGPKLALATTVFEVVVPVWSLAVAKLLVEYVLLANVDGTATWKVSVAAAPAATVPSLQLRTPAVLEQLLEQLMKVVFAGMVSLMATLVAAPLPL